MVKIIESHTMNLDEEDLSFNEAKYNQSTSINLSKYRKDNINIITESKIKTNASENKFYISPEINKGPWTPSEDKLLIEYVKRFGPKKWNDCAEFLKNRTSKQCREHWKNCLDPEIKKGDWTFEEDLILMVFYSKCKGSWSQLIHYFNDRTENSIKNRFFSELRKIAANEPKKEKKRSSKINLKNLLKYLEQGISEAKKNFMTYNKMTEEQLNEYLKKIEIKFLNKKKDKKRKKIHNYSNKYNLLGKKREKKSEEKNLKLSHEKIVNTNNNIILEENTKITEEEKNNNKSPIKNNNKENPKEPITEDIELNENNNINNFLEINQIYNIMETSFDNYDNIIDENNEETEEKENINKNFEQGNNIQRSSSDLIKSILSNNFPLFTNGDVFSIR
jgi:hypothetical protein